MIIGQNSFFSIVLAHFFNPPLRSVLVLEYILLLMKAMLYQAMLLQLNHNIAISTTLFHYSLVHGFFFASCFSIASCSTVLELEYCAVHGRLLV